MYDEQLPPEDQRVQEASTKLPKINSPGTSANRQINISWVTFPDWETFPEWYFLIAKHFLIVKHFLIGIS